jgi:hypothetical protein
MSDQVCKDAVELDTRLYEQLGRGTVDVGGRETTLGETPAVSALSVPSTRTIILSSPLRTTQPTDPVLVTLLPEDVGRDGGGDLFSPSASQTTWREASSKRDLEERWLKSSPSLADGSLKLEPLGSLLVCTTCLRHRSPPSVRQCLLGVTLSGGAQG